MKLNDLPQCINSTQLLEGRASYSCRFLESQRLRLWTTPRTNASCVKLQISWSPLKSLHITFVVVIVSFIGVGEQRVLLFQEEWPQQPYERRSLERERAPVCVCISVDLWLPCFFRKHKAMA